MTIPDKSAASPKVKVKPAANNPFRATLPPPDSLRDRRGGETDPEYVRTPARSWCGGRGGFGPGVQPAMLAPHDRLLRSGDAARWCGFWLVSAEKRLDSCREVGLLEEEGVCGVRVEDELGVGDERREGATVRDRVERVLAAVCDQGWGRDAGGLLAGRVGARPPEVDRVALGGEDIGGDGRGGWPAREGGEIGVLRVRLVGGEEVVRPVAMVDALSSTPLTREATRLCLASVWRLCRYLRPGKA